MTDREPLRSYLLGTISEAEGEALEKRLLVDEELHERLEMEQDALVEAHLRGTLPPPERDAFAARLQANPALWEAARQARLLYERLAPAPPRRSTVPYWLVLAATLLLGAASWWWLGRAPAVPRSAAIPSAGPTTLASPTPKPGATLPTPTPAPVAVAVLTLSPGQVMAGSAPESVVLGPAVERLRIELVLEPPPAASYVAEVSSESGRPVWARGGLRAGVEKGALTVALPAARLARGRYRLELTPVSAQGRGEKSLYYFEVRRP